MNKSTMYEFTNVDDEFSDLKWLATVKQARGDTRDYTELVVVKDGWGHRSDGSILKSVRLGIEPGLYQILKAKGAMILGFVKEIAEKETPDLGDLYNKFSGMKYKTSCEGSAGCARVYGIVTMQSKQIFDPLKFSKLCDDVFGDVEFGDNDDPVIVSDSGGKKKGILMPLRS